MLKDIVGMPEFSLTLLGVTNMPWLCPGCFIETKHTEEARFLVETQSVMLHSGGEDNGPRPWERGGRPRMRLGHSGRGMRSR